MKTINALNKSLDAVKLYASDASNEEKRKQFKKIFDEMAVKVQMILIHSYPIFKDAKEENILEIVHFLKKIFSYQYLDIYLNCNMVYLFFAEEYRNFHEIYDSSFLSDPTKENVEFVLAFMEFIKHLFETALPLVESSIIPFEEADKMIDEVYEKYEKEGEKDKMNQNLAVFFCVKGMSQYSKIIKEFIEETIVELEREIEKVQKLRLK
ncbi:uncharacterized protein MONOS_6611 [Monocercomonoides exilis]|uniref:uncharacterized protein n=1 Tax=Monocercomonoides exilis TaxID=2049356 RepID=UPI003559ED22|nr:hypothetical protein MONOS_6611 [Monocercomonoides exilis]|eukprot:MONOS_6611.1-p1 / transcript=MONOS_6611.1 / gene=MONOS_6611 / organism=Monocercomonoides_exilis_PA203 / gene_product=unspecified product / transcript_product=unspecified product / location=Mono_scaffold00211:33545-34461(+) / protein_length=209 / sequence_SO=supercontig / SO=protein_coding / is_pseudo=false